MPEIRDLKIEIVARDDIGSIVALITTDGVVDVCTASAEIATGRARYFAGPDAYVRAPVRAFSDAGGTYLYANWDGSRRNQLHDLAAAGRRSLRSAAHRTSPPASPVTVTSARPSRWSALFRALGLG